MLTLIDYKEKEKLVICNDKICVELVHIRYKDYIIFEEHLDYYSWRGNIPLTKINFMRYNLHKIPKKWIKEISDKLNSSDLLRMYELPSD